MQFWHVFNANASVGVVSVAGGARLACRIRLSLLKSVKIRRYRTKLLKYFQEREKWQ
jgi:hypothetical protein